MVGLYVGHTAVFHIASIARLLVPVFPGCQLVAGADLRLACTEPLRSAYQPTLSPTRKDPLPRGFGLHREVSSADPIWLVLYVSIFGFSTVSSCGCNGELNVNICCQIQPENNICNLSTKESFQQQAMRPCWSLGNWKAGSGKYCG
jgi:hypothetical protein